LAFAGILYNHKRYLKKINKKRKRLVFKMIHDTPWTLGFFKGATVTDSYATEFTITRGICATDGTTALVLDVFFLLR
jgi:hypothetical protein